MNIDQSNQSGTPKQDGNGWKKAVHILGIIQLISASIILLFNVSYIAMVIVVGYSYPMLPHLGILCGIFALISSSLGVGSLRARGACRDCLVMGHFVMSIISAILDTIQLLLCALHLYSFGHIPNSSMYRGDSKVQTIVAFWWLATVGTLVHVVSSITSTCFTCNAWCTQGVSGTTVTYVPNSNDDPNTAETVIIGNMKKSPKSRPSTAPVLQMA